jgi:hypothetical protein
MALKTMPIAKLQALKSQVEAAISAKVTERRRELESELSKLTGFIGGRRANHNSSPRHSRHCCLAKTSSAPKERYCT